MNMATQTENPSYAVADAIAALDSVFPLATQDGWDNSGLLVGNAADALRGVMLCVDLTPDVVEEAARKDCNLVVSHHPIMFRGLKRLTGSTPEQRTVIEAVRRGVCLAAFHTPADKSPEGTSGSVGRMLGLRGMEVLVPERDSLCKVATYVPLAQAQDVADAMSRAGAGHIGNYSHCSWSVCGEGQFRAEDGANPYVGALGELHHEAEARVEAICPKRLEGAVVRAVTRAHPYEEPAIDVLPLSNANARLGYGVVGNLEKPLSESAFLSVLKERLGCGTIRHAGSRPLISRVAICTGSGAEFAANAIKAGADAYVTADVKYHQMADAAAEILVADVGHYESESVAKSVFKAILTRKLANFAHYEVYRESNPIKYY